MSGESSNIKNNKRNRSGFYSLTLGHFSYIYAYTGFGFLFCLCKLYYKEFYLQFAVCPMHFWMRNYFITPL